MAASSFVALSPPASVALTEVKTSAVAPLVPPGTPLSSSAGASSLVEESKANSANNNLYTTLKVIGTLVGLAALGVFFLYQDPSEQCANVEDCGDWLSSIVGPDVAKILYWILGGTEFALMSFYFAKESLQRWYDYVRNEENNCLKFIKFFIVPGMTVALTMQMYYIMESFHSAAWKTAITVAGDAAGKLFVAANLLQRDLPWLGSQLVSQRCLSEEDKKIEEHYRLQKSNFITQSTNRYSILVRNAAAVIQREEFKNTDANVHLYNQRLYEKYRIVGEYSPSHLALRTVLGLIGAAIGLYMAFVAGLATFHAIQNEFPDDLAKQYSLTILFSSGIGYLCPYVLATGFLHLAEGINNLYHGQRVAWLSYRANPKATVAIIGSAAVVSSVSYAVFNRLMAGNYDGPHKLELVILASLAMGFYHWFGLDKLYDIVRGTSITCGSRTFFGGKNSTEVALQKLGKKLEADRWMTDAAFRKSVEDPANRAMYDAAGVERYSYPVRNDESRDAVETPSRCLQWCSLFADSSYGAVSGGMPPDHPATALRV